MCGQTHNDNGLIVFAWAEELGHKARMPNQIQWGFAGRNQKEGTKYLDLRTDAE